MQLYVIAVYISSHLESDSKSACFFCWRNSSFKILRYYRRRKLEWCLGVLEIILWYRKTVMFPRKANLKSTFERAFQHKNWHLVKAKLYPLLFIPVLSKPQVGFSKSVLYNQRHMFKHAQFVYLTVSTPLTFPYGSQGQATTGHVFVLVPVL